MGERKAVWMGAGVASVGLWVFGSLFSQTLPTEPLPTPLTPWICVPPTVPSYTACSGHPDVVPDVYPFRTGCYDMRTGTPGDCRESWILYQSTEGVTPAAMDYWTGARRHRSGKSWAAVPRSFRATRGP
jgi:hypothetical protein